MSHEQTAKQLMDAIPSCKRPQVQPRTCWQNYVEDLAWSCLGIPPAELLLIAGDQDAWRSQFKLLPPQPQKNKWENENTLNYFNVFPENDHDDDDHISFVTSGGLFQVKTTHKAQCI